MEFQILVYMATDNLLADPLNKASDVGVFFNNATHMCKSRSYDDGNNSKLLCDQVILICDLLHCIHADA